MEAIQAPGLGLLSLCGVAGDRQCVNLLHDVAEGRVDQLVLFDFIKVLEDWGDDEEVEMGVCSSRMEVALIDNLKSYRFECISESIFDLFLS